MDIGQRHAQYADILALHTAAGAGFHQIMCAEQGEAFRHHAGRGVEFAERFEPAGMVAGFLLQFAGGRDSRFFAFLLIADKARRQFDAAFAERHAILIDQQHMASVWRFVDRDDHGGANAARAANIFP